MKHDQEDHGQPHSKREEEGTRQPLNHIGSVERFVQIEQQQDEDTKAYPELEQDFDQDRPVKHEVTDTH